jgi:hypothetical protein
MSDNREKFERFQQEHARLHDPALVRGAVEFVRVEMSEVAPGLARPGKKKKKKRHGVRAGWTPTQVAAPPVVEVPEAERLLPSAFMRKLRAKARVEELFDTARTETHAETPHGEPRVEVEPESVSRSLSLFQEQAFALVAPAAQQVELVWREERAPVFRSHTTAWDTAQRNIAQASTALRGELQRVVMDHTQADSFETQIGIADGAYLFAFSVDGHMRPEARYARRVLLNRDGLFAPLALARHAQTLTLTNRNKFAERVQLEANVLWLVPEQIEINLPARGSVKTTVRFHLPAMLSGLNEGLLHLKAKREEGTAVAGIIHFAAQVEVGGAVPEISFVPQEFGEVRQGLDEPQLWVEVTARGRGPLTGMVSLPHSGELADFRLDAEDDGDAARFAHKFQVASANLPQPQPHRTDAALKVMLITDSFLANYRLCRAEIPYRLVHLKKSMPALSFGTVRAGARKSMRLEVERSDKQEIELSVTLPEGVASYLEAYPARADAYVFRFDANALEPGTSISETVELIDRRSGLRDQIKVLANVARGTDETVRAVVSSSTS